jgi:hypothetical protein
VEHLSIINYLVKKKLTRPCTGLGVCGDGFLHGVVIIIDGALEGVGAIKDEADETAHSVF